LLKLKEFKGLAILGVREFWEEHRNFFRLFWYLYLRRKIYAGVSLKFQVAGLCIDIFFGYGKIINYFGIIDKSTLIHCRL